MQMQLAWQIIIAFVLSFSAAYFVVKVIDVVRSGSAPKIQTPALDFAQLNELIAPKPGELITELGCGNGKFLKFIATKNPNTKFIGMDNGLIAVMTARAQLISTKNVKIRLADIAKQQKFSGTKFYGYLSPSLISLIAQKLPRGARLISLEYAADGMKPLKVIKLNNPTKLVSKVYIYKIS